MMKRSDYKIGESEPVIITNTDNPYKQVDAGNKAPYFNPVGNPDDVDLEIQAGSYTGDDKKTYNWPELKLTGALINITQTKNIVTTSVAGRSGTVKEYIAMGDYAVDIVATVTAPNGDSALDEMAALIAIKTAPVSLKVNSAFLLKYDIYNLVIKDFKVEQQAGRYSTQVVKISAISDTPYIIEQNVKSNS
ncbi:MAG: hypothetical protein EOP56_08245 [Sphingobacteriales bacterium]|nr:MAG: hypothetical protein EOP56_08245 [Sphingobacteriales bacterium]